MTINNKSLSTLQGLVTATSTTEGDFRTGMNDILAQVNANQEDLAINVNNPQVITTLTSGSTYTIPSNALAIYIRAGGGGRGGSRYDTFTDPDSGPSVDARVPGGAGGNTTISNTALSLSITARGGGVTAGSDSGGTIQKHKGGSGGASNSYGAYFDIAEGGTLVSTYINNSNVGGKTLSYSIGAGGTKATNAAQNGDTGYIELWIW